MATGRRFCLATACRRAAPEYTIARGYWRNNVMATEELLVTHTIRFTRRYCAFTGPDGQIRAAAKRPARLLASFMLLSFVSLLVATVTLVKGGKRDDASFWFVLSFMGFVALPLMLMILQVVAQSYVRMNFSSGDPFPMVCTIRNTEYAWFSTPSRFALQIPNSDVEVNLRVPAKGQSIAQIAERTVLKSQAQTRPRGFVVRTPPLHVDFEDHAGHKATLDGSHGKRGRYRLVYDEKFDSQWLLLVVVATLLLRSSAFVP